MKLPRRRFLHLASSAAALSAMPRIASARDYPTRPVHLVLGFPAGSAPDIVARLVGEPLSKRLGQGVVVDDRPGAGGSIAAEAVIRAAPDGYTLLWATIANAINATIYPNLNFNFVRDATPVASIGGFDHVVVVNPAVPAKSIPDFIVYAKANPGRINMASPGNGTAVHIFGELFKMMAGVELVHVPYRASYMPDLLGGQTQVAFTPIPLSIAYIRNNQLRALAVTGAKRSIALPDVPTVGEFVPGYEASTWVGLAAPKSTSAEIIGKLNREINVIIVEPNTKSRLNELGVSPTPMAPADFGKHIADETEKWAKVIKAANIKPE